MNDASGSTRDLLTSACEAFNQHDIDAVLALMHPDIDWPNGMQGGRMRGHQAIRDYWTRLWATLNPQVTPLMFAGSERSGTIVVDVHQVIRDLSGSIIVDQIVQHVYSIRDGLIERMDIRNADGELTARYL
jgi:hypothetical protein